MFADISGFTQWSSEREPSQVFTLLEQIYNSFDAIAKKKRIFKVETIGDCYVAAAGLPEPRKDHAVAMARFAHDCRSKMNSVVKKLEVLLGPDTADLTMRFGLHSGPVTAGVLRGEKSRFQLFGDTVNTAARMESTGARNKIHISQATADLLLKADKGSWVKERESMVSAKGKGLMQTYWLSLKDTSLEPVCNASKTTATWSSVHSTDFCSHPHAQENGNEEMVPSDDRTQRLIEWNVDVLQRQLKKTIAMRNASTKKSNRKPSEVVEVKLPDGSMVLDEVKEVIPLSTESKTYRQNPEDIQLSVAVLIQLRDYVSAIAGMYKDNPFHNFAHASHVTQSVTKLLSRVVTPESIDYKDMCYKKQAGANDLHEYTYGITSDPLIQFACAFSALIHDVDHTGLPNAQLVKENSEIAKIYKNKSVAEQNSVDIAWGLLMEPSYGELRNCIYQTQEELERFRQLIVNAVMATDIADKEQAVFRKKRWAKAFNQEEGLESMAETSKEAVNRKATIVIEHLIQASDVSHTMQHWHVYLKWNERLFHEMYNAYLEGRAENDPSETWYQGELGFYDFYIIPLAKKLKDCGVFGVASDEYLDYATANRTEWELKGKEIVQGYLTLYKKNESGSNLGLATKESSVVEELVLPVPLSMAAKESSLVEELVLPLPIEIE
jgi:class 3 adenylate cyclase